MIITGEDFMGRKHFDSCAEVRGIISNVHEEFQDAVRNNSIALSMIPCNNEDANDYSDEILAMLSNLDRMLAEACPTDSRQHEEYIRGKEQKLD